MFPKFIQVSLYSGMGEGGGGWGDGVRIYDGKLIFGRLIGLQIGGAYIRGGESLHTGKRIDKILR